MGSTVNVFNINTYLTPLLCHITPAAMLVRDIRTCLNNPRATKEDQFNLPQIFVPLQPGTYFYQNFHRSGVYKGIVAKYDKDKKCYEVLYNDDEVLEYTRKDLVDLVMKSSENLLKKFEMLVDSKDKKTKLSTKFVKLKREYPNGKHGKELIRRHYKLFST